MKRIFYSVALLAATMIGFTSCEEEEESASDKLVGDYSAELTYMLSEDGTDFLNISKSDIESLGLTTKSNTVTVSKDGEDALSIKIGNDTFKTTKIEEEKNQERYYEEERQLKNVYSRVDERMESIFTGEYNIGIVGVFDGKNKFGFSTGLDLNFNVYRKNFGHGAGHLFTGLGFDFEYYIPTPLAKYSEHLLEIPIMANLGYYFRTNNYTLRYVGLWSSLGAGIDIFLWKSSSNDDKIKNDIYSSFAWEIGFNMIFRNSFTANFGFGGFAGKAYKNTNGIHFFSNIGWIL